MQRIKFRRKVLELKKEENKITNEVLRKERELLRKQFEDGLSGKLTIEQMN